jgi:hypothetical protein
MVAMETPADDVAEFGFGASAFAMEPLLPLLYERSVGLGRHRFCVAQLLCGSVLGASAKLDGASAVVVSFHQETADALAVFAALPIVPREITIMTVAHASPNVPLTPQGLFLAALLPAHSTVGIFAHDLEAMLRCQFSEVV